MACLELCRQAATIFTLCQMIDWLQSCDQWVEQASLLTSIAEGAAECPGLAATLASRGLLGLLLQAAAELAGTCGAEQQVGGAAAALRSRAGSQRVAC